MKQLLNARHIPLLATAGVCLALYVTAAVLLPGFASAQVFVNLFADNSFLGIIAVGMTLVIISGGIDLSVGAVMALCSIVMAVLMQDSGASPGLAIATAIGIGGLFGCVTGCVVHFLKLEPFIATLGAMFLARGLALIVRSESVPISNDFYSRATQMQLCVGDVSIPLTAFALLGVVAVGIYLSGHTSFGRNCYAIGGGQSASLLMGLPVGRTKVMAYTFSGLCSAVAAVVFTFYGSAGNPVAGMGMEMDAIAIVVIGGALLSGGVGYVIGTLVGTLIFGIIQTGIMFQGTLNSWWTKVAIGILLLVFIMLQRLFSRSVYGGREA